MDKKGRKKCGGMMRFEAGIVNHVSLNSGPIELPYGLPLVLVEAATIPARGNQAAKLLISLAARYIKRH